MRKFLRLQILPLILTLAGLLYPTRAFGQLSSTGTEQVVSYSGSTAFILSNVPANPNLLTSTGQNEFILSVTQPNNAVRVYVTNDTANACANFQIQIASTGNSSLNSFNANPQAWQTVNVQTGGNAFVSTLTTFNLPANATVAWTSQPLVANKIVLFLPVTSGCATTSIDLQVVFGVFTANSPNVQGTLAPGAPNATQNPVVIGLTDISSTAKVCDIQTSLVPTSVIGAGIGCSMPIGVTDAPTNPSYTTVRLPGSTSDGPLAVAGYAQVANNAASIRQLTRTVGTNGTSGCDAGASINTACGGLIVSASGFIISGPLTFSATGDTLLWNVSTQIHEQIESCEMSALTSAVSGTTPTLDLYLQDSDDGITWDDRIHLAQVTVSPNTQSGSITFATGSNVHTYSQTALAAATVVNGPIKARGRLHAVVGGTSPIFTTSTFITCR